MSQLLPDDYGFDLIFPLTNETLYAIIVLSGY